MLRPISIKRNPDFIGRRYEIARLEEITKPRKATLIVVHGRRRVGKTELVEQFFRERNILKFEGVEGKTEAWQRQQILRQLAEYAGDPSIGLGSFSTWVQVLEQIARHTAHGQWTILFEELQWLAD